MFLTIDFDFSACILAKQHLVTFLDIQGDNIAILHDFALANGNDLALNGLFFGRVRNDDSPLAFILFPQSFDQDSIVQRSNLHGLHLL